MWFFFFCLNLNFLYVIERDEFCVLWGIILLVMYWVDFFGCYIVYFCSVLYNLWYWMIFFIYYDKYLFFLRCDINSLFVLCLCNKIL